MEIVEINDEDDSSLDDEDQGVIHITPNLSSSFFIPCSFLFIFSLYIAAL